MYIIRIKKAGINFIKGLFVIILLIMMFTFCNKIERHYTMEATITGVENEMIILEDKQGHIWRWINYKRDLKEGQKVKLIFFDKGTEEIRKDDEIIKFKRLNK